MIRSAPLFLFGFLVAGALPGCGGSDPFTAAVAPQDHDGRRDARVRSFADAIADGMMRARAERIRELATRGLLDPG